MLRRRPLPPEAEHPPASPAAALTGDGPPPLPDEGWPSDEALPKLIFGGPTAFLLASIIGAPLAQISALLGAGLIILGVIGAGVTGVFAYASLYRRWREIGAHARALGRLIVTSAGKEDERADVAFRLLTVAESHRSARALAGARARLEELHRSVLEKS
jgi:hypothetical protein